MITTEQIETCDLTHRHGGNSYVMCQMLDDGYVRVTPRFGKESMKRAFLASVSMLTPSQKASDSMDPKSPRIDDVLPESELETFQELRKKIESGELKIKNQRIA